MLKEIYEWANTAAIIVTLVGGIYLLREKIPAHTKWNQIH